MSSFGNIIVWATILQWVAIAGAFVYDAVKANARSRRQYKTALEVGNGRLFVAKKRKDISRWILAGSSLALALGLLSVFSNAFLPHPPPDTRIIGALIREGIVVMLFSFWQATRSSVLLQNEADTKRGQMKSIQETTADTNKEVHKQGLQITEMQKRGKDERPGVVLDQTQGAEHRKIIEEHAEEGDERRAEDDARRTVDDERRAVDDERRAEDDERREEERQE